MHNYPAFARIDNMTVRELTYLIKKDDKEHDDRTITGLFYDSTSIIKDSVFFCFRGTRTNGELYIQDAIDRGAIAIVCEKDIQLPLGVKCISTQENIRSVYAKVSRAFFKYPDKNLKLIGVSGTDGKSSTSYFIYQLLKSFGKAAGLTSTVYVDDCSGLKKTPWRLSTPEAFPLHSFLKNACNNGCEYMVIEATSHALSKEYDRLEGIHFTSSLLTRITSEHLDFHKTHRAYIDSKLRLFEMTDGKCFILSDNIVRKEAEERFESKVKVLDRPEIVSLDNSSLTFIYDYKEYTLPFIHSYMLENAFTAASLVSSLLSLPLPDVLMRLSDLKRVEGRDELVQNNIGRNIIIDFAHTPDSVSRLLSDYRALYPDGEFITVLGAAGERDKSKRAGLGREASRYSSHLILTEEDNRNESFDVIVNDILSGIPTELRSRVDIQIIERREDAISKALEISSVKDSIFLLGKGHEMSIEGKEKRKYSEREAVRNALSDLCAICSR